MAKVRSRVLVIDASIARAAGEVSMHPTSRDCREFLQAVLRLAHRMAMTARIQEEWNKHQSNFARRWRTAMVARRRIDFVEVAPQVTGVVDKVDIANDQKVAVGDLLATLVPELFALEVDLDQKRLGMQTWCETQKTKLVGFIRSRS